MTGQPTDKATRRSDRRNDMLHTVSVGLNNPSGALIGIDPIRKREGYSKQDILSAFGSIDDLLVAIAERKASLLSDPLINCGNITDVDLRARTTVKLFLDGARADRAVAPAMEGQ